jgi:hypothetical protein
MYAYFLGLLTVFDAIQSLIKNMQNTGGQLITI